MKANPLPPIETVLDVLKYDPDTGIFTWRTNEKVAASVRGKIAGTLAANGYRRIKINGSCFLAHRLAWLILEGEDPGDLQVDHINGITDDNRRENLRLVTRSENQHNQRSARGYCFHKRDNNWKAQIMLNGKQHYLGLYTTKEEARAAYLEAKAKLHPTSPITK
jgi:hypothetical protein